MAEPGRRENGYFLTSPISAQLFSRMRLPGLIILSHLIGFRLFAQDAEAVREELTLQADIRPRAEFRSNYRLAPSDSSTDFFVSQRNRLYLTYRRQRFTFHAAAQEIHLWGKGDQVSAIGTIGFYELYLEPVLSPALSLRIGRQGISLDNGRIFSDAHWAQQGRSHEGIRLMYTSPRLKADLITAFSRKYSTRFDPAYSPVAAHTYQWLLVPHLKYKLNNHYTLTVINAAEAFARTNPVAGSAVRATSGGRFEYLHKRWYLTLSAYYQYGESAGAQNIRAYYLQPEMSYTLGPVKFRLGAEFASGGNPDDNASTFRSFVPLYGVAWKFMGNMNFFTRFPSDVNGSGLVNPYLFTIFTVNNKLNLRADGNLFYTQYPLRYPDKTRAGTYLGFENDLSVQYTFSSTLDMQGGISYLIPAGSMQLLNKVADPSLVAVWTYWMISFRPRLFSFRRNHPGPLE
jgi:hypothetical protein